MSEIVGPPLPPHAVGHFVLYDSDGRIVMGMTAPEATAQLNVQPGHQLLRVPPGLDIEAHYVDGGTWQPRPQCAAQLEGSRLVDLPAPCKIRINDAAYDCPDATADLEFDQPGTYRVVVSAWPYMDKEFTVENPPQ